MTSPPFPGLTTSNWPGSPDQFPFAYDDNTAGINYTYTVGSLPGMNYGFILGYNTLSQSTQDVPRGAFSAGTPQIPPMTATALPGYNGGNIAGTGGGITYTYSVTLLTQYGETLPWSTGNDVSVTTTSEGAIYLGNIPSIGTTPTLANPIIGRCIYRVSTAMGGSTKYLVATIPDDTTFQFIDLLPDAQVGRAAPVSDTSGLTGNISLMSGGKTWVETYCNVASPSASVPIHSGSTYYFAVDYTYSATGGWVYFNMECSGFTGIMATYTGGTLIDASLMNSVVSAINSLESVLGPIDVSGYAGAYANVSAFLDAVNRFCFPVGPPPPPPPPGYGTLSATTFSPSSGLMINANTVTVQGTGFSSGTVTVNIAGVIGVSTIVSSDTSLTFTTPVFTDGTPFTSPIQVHRSDGVTVSATHGPYDFSQNTTPVINTGAGITYYPNYPNLGGSVVVTTIPAVGQPGAYSLTCSSMDWRASMTVQVFSFISGSVATLGPAIPGTNQSISGSYPSGVLYFTAGFTSPTTGPGYFQVFDDGGAGNTIAFNFV